MNLHTDTSNPFFLPTSESSPGTSTLVSQILVGSENYNTWCIFMMVALESKNKLRFINGDITMPALDDPMFNAWNRINAMIISWIGYSVSAEIASSIIHIKSAYKMWNGLKERFSEKSNVRMYQLKRAVCECKQEGMSVKAYFTKLKTLWDEYMSYNAIPHCSYGNTCTALRMILDFRHRDYTMQFLVGLNDSYDDLRNKILLNEPLPSINEVFASVVQEERQRGLSNVKIDEPIVENQEIAPAAFGTMQAPVTQAQFNQPTTYFNSQVAPFSNQGHDGHTSSANCSKQSGNNLQPQCGHSSVAQNCSPPNTNQSSYANKSGTRWKGKGSKAKADADPMSNIVSQLQSSLIKSNSQGLLAGRSVLLEADVEQTECLNRSCFGQPIITVITAEKDKQWFQLSLEEAFYLYHSLKCLNVLGYDGCLKPDLELWHYMKSLNKTFPVLYKAYSHLRTKNWVVRSGTQYGVDFVSYRHHPALVHSEYAVLVLSEEDTNQRLQVWSDLECTLRLSGSVAKTLLTLNVNKNGYSDASSSCLENFSIEERTITRWSPEQCRENNNENQTR